MRRHDSTQSPLGSLGHALGMDRRAAGAASRRQPEQHSGDRSDGAQSFRTMTARFAPVDLTADVACAAAERATGARQAGRGGEGLRRAVPAPGLGGQRAAAARRCSRTRPLGRARLHYFLINKGPWSRLDHNEPFIPGLRRSRRRATSIRPARRRKRSRRGSRTLPAAERRGPPGFFTTIRRDAGRRFRPCPTASSTRASSGAWRRCSARRPP